MAGSLLSLKSHRPPPEDLMNVTKQTMDNYMMPHSKKVPSI